MEEKYPFKCKCAFVWSSNREQRSCCLPGFPHAGEAEAFVAGIAHDISQIQKQSLFKVGKALDFIAVLQSKEGVAGKAEGGIMEADGVKVLPCLPLFLC